MTDNTDKSEFYEYLGAAAVILALCLGLSTCGLVATYRDKMKIEMDAMKNAPKPGAADPH